MVDNIREDEYPTGLARRDNLDLWERLREINSGDLKSLQKTMVAFGYSRGEVEELTGKLKTTKRDRVEEIKEELYLRHKLRLRLLQDHCRDSNLLVTLQNMREEESHLIDNLTKLGEIAPVQTASVVGNFGIEQLILNSYKKEQKELPQLKDITEEEPIDEIGTGE